MKLRLLFLTAFFSYIYTSCESKCTLLPMSKNTFDLSKVKDLALSSGDEIDTLKVTEKVDSYTETSYKGPMNYRECEHVKLYDIKFKDYIISVSVRKHEDETIDLDVNAFGTCNTFPSEVRVTEEDLMLSRQYLFDAEPDCEAPNSIFKQVILKGYLIQSITTNDNKVWTAHIK